MKSTLLLVLVVVCSLGVCLARPRLINSRFVEEDGKDFFAKGVGYAPVPVGADPTAAPPYGDYFTLNYQNIYKRDLPVIKKLGANIIRLWGWNVAADHSDFLNQAHEQGLYVAPEFWIGPSSYPNLADEPTVTKLTADFNQFLTTTKNHSAILFYIIGSDLNAPWNYGGELDVLFNVLNQLTKILHGRYPGSIVTTALNDNDSANTIAKYDLTTELDLWSLNVYRGCDFGPLFALYQAGSSRPLFISEYGIDSYNDVVQAEDDATQAACVVALTKEIIANSSVSFGGAVVEYVDEYWKAKLGQADGRHPGCPSYNAALHTNCGNPNDAFPDKYVNQAWFGIVSATIQPRMVYTALSNVWATV